MQRENKWANWPVLAIGVVLVYGLLSLAQAHYEQHVLSNYFEDVAGAITTVVLSIATYDEWERRRQRRRYRGPEQMGRTRIQDEVYQLLYQYAFVLSLRWEPKSRAMQTIRDTAAGKEFTKPEGELQVKAAKHLAQENPQIKDNLFDIARRAFARVAYNKTSYADMNELILQTERAIRQIDLSISTYGYSFTPEVHKWALDVREALSQAITGDIPVLSLRLTAASKQADKALRKEDQEGVRQLLQRLDAVGELAGVQPT